MVVAFKASVGSRRLHRYSDETMQAITRAVRGQMLNVVKDVRRWVEHMEQQAPEILVEALQPTFEKSQKYVPIDTGELKASGYLRVRKVATGAFAEMGYALGGKPHYAVVVHEDLEANHKSPTRAKFLQAALEEDSGDIERRIDKLLKRAGGI